MSEEDTDNKSFEPTQRRLDEARKRGEIARAPDVNAALAYLGLCLAALIAGEAMLKESAVIGLSVIDHADRLSSAMSAGARASLAPVLLGYVQAFLPIFALPFLCVLLGLMAQRGLIFAPEKLEFRLSRLSPIETAKQKFGIDGLFSFASSVAKMLAIGVILAVHLMARAGDIANSMQLPAAAAMGLMLRLMAEFLLLILLIAVVFGGIDFFWPQAQHLKRNRMSHKEMLDEHKESEGDPHTKFQRRQKGQEIALNRMLQDVAKADVVIVNPTHYAVALQWKRSDRHAPICVAKGVDEIAARIRERAVLAGVPLRADPPTARAIHAAVEIGQPIRPEHYKPVAAAIRFAEALRHRKR
jgi:flagellar biosynthetic protein FlhB